MTRLRQALDELRSNPEQWEAFQEQGHCVVIAPPGSGKTKLLTTKAVWLANNSVAPPRGLACITLTNPAAAELRTRIRHLGQPIGSTTFVGTVHAFAWSRIVRPFATAVGFPDWSKYTIAPALRAKAAMDAAIRRVYGPAADVRSVPSTIRRNRRLNISEKDWRTFGSRAREAALEYERILREDDYIDYDSAVAMAVQLVEQHPFVQLALHARYPHLMVDEYQDLAPGLHRIVTSLALEHGQSTLFAVGDPDQSIYGWTGTRPELLMELAGRDGVHRVDLRINYRSREAIAQAGRRILGASGTEAVTIRSGGSVSARCEPEGLSAQAAYIATRIQALWASGVPLHEIAILAPTNDDCEAVAEVLRHHSVPAAWRGRGDLQSPLSVTLETAAVWVAYGREESGYKLGDVLDLWRQLADRDSMRASTDQLVAVLLASSSGAPARELVEGVVEVLDLSGVLAHLRSDDADALSRMRPALAQGGEMAACTVRDLGGFRLRNGRVEVATMTSSKGLEFDHVFIAAMDEGRLPHYKSPLGSPAWLEDRRKFYVSCTRARDSVEILYSGWYETAWGIQKRGPSAFLRESGFVVDDLGRCS